MSMATTITADAKTARRKPSKTAAPQKAEVVKKCVYLAPKLEQRLSIAAIMEGKTETQLINEILEASSRLSTWVVSNRPRSSQLTESEESPAALEC